MQQKKADQVFLKGTSQIYQEIRYILKTCFGDEFDYSEFEYVYGDIIRLFKGNYPGYQPSKTKYHDLEHTVSMTLACVRLIHGALLSKEIITQKSALLAIISALFHDTGLIQKRDEPNRGTGAKYTIGHEERSKKFLRDYLEKRGKFLEEDIRNCEEIIDLTNLNKTPENMNFSSDEIRLITEIVATADIVSQMADRVYLEKLRFLFEEFTEAGINHFISEYDLLAKTQNFYEIITKKRIEIDLENVERFAKVHFAERLGKEKDFYLESIERNLKYLRIVIKKAGNNYDRFFKRELLE